MGSRVRVSQIKDGTVEKNSTKATQLICNTFHIMDEDYIVVENTIDLSTETFS